MTSDKIVQEKAIGWLCPILLLCVVTLIWCYAYNRWSREAWEIPISYAGDAWAEMATAKSYAFDGVRPILTKYPASLGAPFQANWNDHLTSEEGVFVFYAALVRAFGIFVGSNLAVLAVHLLAAISFYAVCRSIAVHHLFSLVLALLFSLSHYAFVRGLPHLVLTSYWHVPLGLLVVWWCVDHPAAVRRPRKLLLCIAVAFVHGIQDPYYTGMFVQFLVLATIVALVRGRSWADVGTPLVLSAVALGAFVLINLDTIYYRLIHGPNIHVTVRAYAGIELFALKPLELLLPATHRLHTFQDWANNGYFSQALFVGEGGSPYLGIIAIVSLFWLCWRAAQGLITKDTTGVPRQFWYIAWILAFSIVGGINGFIGTFGMVLFRGTNRYSIVIMCLALLFLAKELTQRCRAWPSLRVALFASLILVVGLWDQLPIPPTLAEIHATGAVVAADRNFVKQMESKLPRDAMVFELPISDFPEVVAIRQMGDYEHLRPYLHSHHLRFSYGSDKGRSRERWQREAESLGTITLVKVLQSYGFSAVFINRKAYEDNAVSLQSEFLTATQGSVVADSTDFVCISLTPTSDPTLPPEFDTHWYGLEGSLDANRRWSDGTAVISLHNRTNLAKLVHVNFGLAALDKRKVDIFTPTGKIYASILDPREPPTNVDIVLSIPPGGTELRFETDLAGQLPGNGDSRKLAFDLMNFKVQP